jgi:hypothetical protein
MTPCIHHRRRHKLIEVLRWPTARPAPSVNGDGQPAGPNPAPRVKSQEAEEVGFKRFLPALSRARRSRRL